MMGLEKVSLHAARVHFAFKMTELTKYIGYIFLGNRIFIILSIKDLPYPDICDIKESQEKICNFS